MKSKLFFLLHIPLTYLASANAVLDAETIDDMIHIYDHIAMDIHEITNEQEYITSDKIKYFLFTKSNPKKPIEITEKKSHNLAIKASKIVFLIHGWGENRSVSWYNDLKNVFLSKKNPYAVVQVDWSYPASKSYAMSAWNTVDIGDFFGEFLVNITKKHKIPYKNILLVGHSLGGHVAGRAAKRFTALTGKKLPRIIALDPAGPIFDQKPIGDRLNDKDADVVHVLHTNGGTFGFEQSLGTIDFYVNGGSLQPGCFKRNLLRFVNITDSVSCDHKRSWEYFIEAVSKPTHFLAVKCQYGWGQFMAGSCDSGGVTLGNLTTTETGEFYLKTNSQKPFSVLDRKESGFRITDLLQLWGTLRSAINY